MFTNSRVMIVSRQLGREGQTVDGTTSITPDGVAKLENFLAGLPPDHLEAFEKYLE